jgi:uncharacterized repeat protein (TIGR01451 family)
MRSNITSALILCLLLGLLPVVSSADSGVIVDVEAPAYVRLGGDFTARITVSEVSDFDAYQFDAAYDPSVIEVTSVTAGKIGDTVVPIDMWGFIPSGTQGEIRVIGNVPGASGVSGSGYLAEIHFHIIGSCADTSNIQLFNGLLGDKNANPIAPVSWGDASVLASEVDLELSKEVDDSSPGVGEDVTFSITLINQGPCQATGVQVEEVGWPHTIEYVEHSGGTYNQSTGIWDVGTLAAGGSTMLQITGTLLQEGGFVNAAEVSACNEPDQDSTPGNFLTDPADEDDAAELGGTASSTAVTLSSFAAKQGGQPAAYLLLAVLMAVVAGSLLWGRRRLV